MPRRTPLPILTLAVLLSGCAGNAYLDAKRNTAAGGKMDQDIAASQADLDRARAQNASLQSATANRQAEIDRDKRRVASLESDLRKQDATLAAALKSGKVTKARHAELKKQLDQLKGDTQSAELDAQRLAMAKTPDAQATAAKEKQLQDLEKRKKGLEDALAAMAR
ncbi:hypothetical protein [Pseudorhodoferax sp. Leaf267]|uniref:hypothetical protein n=1 Tax=Pseudorhodoferax sp. Leaf267 TaxID=1736316 RepID=UPI0006FC7124|nr:hypothetical protein [Pseudorhodoferax sp. Leaf267]KQP11866.1 hypothetical protein ASF43_23215 [Pseudorhodoferax sp. Leaf267]